MRRDIFNEGPLRPVRPLAERQLRSFFWLTAACNLAATAACTSSLEGPPDATGAVAGTAMGASAGSGQTPPPTGGATSAGGTGAAGGSPGTGGTAPAAGSGGTSSTGAGGTSSAGAAGSAGVGPIFANPPPYQPLPGMLRRLTRTQFRNALRDVFGAEVDITALDADSWDGNMAVIGAATVVTSELGVEQYQTAVESAVDGVFSDATARSKFIGCTPTSDSMDTCLRGFIQELGQRAWRRPLVPAELDRIASVASSAATTLGSAVEGARWATVALFTSPSFLYRPELGAPAADGSLRLTDYEMASRLAFLVWNSIPDQALLDDAAKGTLATTDGVRAEVEHLLQAPAGREAASAFAEEFLRLDRIATQAKDPSLFPTYVTALQQGMAHDIRDTWAVLTFDDGASVLDLFSTPKVVVNTELATLYGLDPTGLTSTTFQVRSLPSDGPRLGLMSKAGFLSEYANQKEGSPTLRGRFIREQLLCTPIPNPPPGVNAMLPDLPADMPMTKRQRLEAHRTDRTCAGCHEAMDPLGLPLELFDAIGAYRTTDHGLDIDPSGDFDGTVVADARALGFAIAADPAVGQCLLRKYYSYAMGHGERDEDGSVLNALSDAFATSGWKLRDLIVAVATQDAFATVAPQL